MEILLQEKKVFLLRGTYIDTDTTSVFIYERGFNTLKPLIPLTMNFNGVQTMLDGDEIASCVNDKSLAKELFALGIFKDTGHRIFFENKIIQKWKILKDITYIKDLV